jgi:hypothetical protein
MARTTLPQRGFVLSAVVPPERARLLHEEATKNERSVSDEIRAVLEPYFVALERDASGKPRYVTAAF